MHATFLSHLSQAQCERRPESLSARAEALRESLVANILLFDHVLIGITDLLSNNVLYQRVFGDKATAIEFLAHAGASGAPLKAVAIDRASFREVGERLTRGDTLIGGDADDVIDRAKMLDDARVPIVLYDGADATDTNLALRTFRARYTEGLLLGLSSLSVHDRYPRGLDQELVQGGLRLAKQIEVRVADGPLSQSAVWALLGTLDMSAEVTLELQRLSDLAYQAAMGRGTPAQISSADGFDTDFMFATMWSEYRSFLRHAPDKHADPAEKTRRALSLHFRMESVHHLTVREALRLREKSSFVDLRRFLVDLTTHAKPDYLGLARRLREFEYAIKVVAVPNDTLARARLDDMESLYKASLSNRALEKLSSYAMSAVAKGGAALGGSALFASMLANASSEAELVAAIAGGAAGYFGVEGVGAFIKSFQVRSHDYGAPPVTESLYRLALEVGEVRGVR